MPNEQVTEILRRIKDIHDKKSVDYATEDNRYSNFERSAAISSWFKNDVDKTFTTLIGVKLARLAELLNGKEAKNESVDDSFLDLCTYCVVWMSYRQEQNKPLTGQRILDGFNGGSIAADDFLNYYYQCEVCRSLRSQKETTNAK